MIAKKTDSQEPVLGIKTELYFTDSDKWTTEQALNVIACLTAETIKKQEEKRGERTVQVDQV